MYLKFFPCVENDKKITTENPIIIGQNKFKRNSGDNRTNQSDNSKDIQNDKYYNSEACYCTII